MGINTKEFVKTCREMLLNSTQSFNESQCHRAGTAMREKMLMAGDLQMQR